MECYVRVLFTLLNWMSSYHDGDKSRSKVRSFNPWFQGTIAVTETEVSAAFFRPGGM